MRQLVAILQLDEISHKIHFLNGLDKALEDWLTTQIEADEWDLEKLVNNVTKYDNRRKQAQERSKEFQSYRNFREQRFQPQANQGLLRQPQG